MIIKIKEVGKDANGDITINADYYARDGDGNPKTIINKNSVHSKELTKYQVLLELKGSSPSEETVTEEEDRLAEIAKEDALVAGITADYLNVEKAFDPANFEEDEE